MLIVVCHQNDTSTHLKKKSTSQQSGSILYTVTET